MGKLIIECDAGKISDGYHTFDELYEHRCLLFVALIMSNPRISWRARCNSDGSKLDGWFIAGMDLPTGQIGYHLPERMWHCFDKILGPINLSGTGRQGTFDRAPEWDGHTSEDVLKRIAEWVSL